MQKLRYSNFFPNHYCDQGSLSVAMVVTTVFPMVYDMGCLLYRVINRHFMKVNVTIYFTFYFIKILSTVVTSILLKQIPHIRIKYAFMTLQWFWSQIYFLVNEAFVVMNLLNLRKTFKKVFALSFELKETTPFSFNDILDCLHSLEGIPTKFKLLQSF